MVRLDVRRKTSLLPRGLPTRADDVASVTERHPQAAVDRAVRSLRRVGLGPQPGIPASATTGLTCVPSTLIVYRTPSLNDDTIRCPPGEKDSNPHFPRPDVIGQPKMTDRGNHPDEKDK